ncbi:MAG TPA: c-type cytochrome [Terriglobales bacterium]|nr:c-type cytochrome [Terriglobales bacterium]
MKSTFGIQNVLLAVLISIGLAALAVNVALARDEGTDMSHDHLHHHHRRVFANVPEKARLRSNPMANDRDAIEGGKKLFGQHCAECHGEAAEGSHRAPSLRAEEVQNATPGAIFWVLSNGVIRHGMPDWSKLPEAQRWQIATYIRSLRSKANGEVQEGESRDALAGRP